MTSAAYYDRPKIFRICRSTKCIPGFRFSDEFCEEFPHNFIPTPGYWIECSRQKITSDTIWDESESEHENEIQEGEEDEVNTDGMEHENGFSRRTDRSK